ncbi:MAG: dicarboxylate/amino acid:cation symporter [Ignavibacteriota bacterium]|nr:dicarboxylate/amino acid:cation symporter [Ignavibacteriota bacterium]MCO6448300.1 dicarboxylate/amino acid:cation symporter [Ignavibacterium album]MCZ2268538.1 dicarboxylate/amino acid:cation symporter [Ignavibacteriales bacterium]QKK00921.1 MAG: dicarboxylate/amino acid:cation symporter [Ignavibacteriota bacterium]HOJ08108.1 dicarboxylate/amino acid:cation symporter [Ignavibacteriaceae bacterium]
MQKLKLHWQILIAFIIAVLLGLFFPQSSEYVKWLGDLFLRALKMIIVPLVFSSIVSGVVNLGSSSSLGRLGAKTMTYYITTSLAAILTGLILVDLIRPGVGADLGFRMEVHDLTSTTGSLGDIILRIVPTNLFEVFVKGDMLAIIFFALLFGFFIPRVSEKYSMPLISFFNSIFEVMMKLTSFIIKFAPIGILGIVTGIVADQASDKAKLVSMLEHLGVYMLTVLSGLAIHMFITLPLLLKILGRVRPFLHFKALSLPLITAFSTSSSSATLPLTIEAVENNVGVSNKISSLVLPLGATINMDGTALYECVAAMFIAQAYGIELSFIQQMIVVVTALLASIGAAGIPMAGLVMMSIVLTSVGLPLEGVGLILAIDRPLDMCRTTVNVFSDTCGAAIIAKTEGEILKV